MDRLPVLATKTYFPALVIQHDAACPAAMTDANEPSRNRPSWFECASVISAVPSGYVANPKGASEPSGAETAVGADPLTLPRSSAMMSTVPGSGSVFSVTSSCLSPITPT